MHPELSLPSLSSHGDPTAVAGPSSVAAIMSLVLGIAAWTVLPLVGGIMAIRSGHAARREVRDQGLPGAGMARAGLILGYTNVLACVVFGLALAALLAVGFSFLPD